MPALSPIIAAVGILALPCSETRSGFLAVQPRSSKSHIKSQQSPPSTDAWPQPAAEHAG
jgi:hypothetical protein